MNTQTNQTTPTAPVIAEKGGAVPTGNLLVERVHNVTLQVIEEAVAEGKPKKVKVRGEFGRAGIATENKRVYPAKLWEREIGRLQKAFENRQVFGELDHPADGRTSLQRASHIVTNLTVNDNGIVVGESEILDTEQGRNLKALLAAGCKVGVSSRGYGSTKPNDMGEDVVQEDYRLVTFDFVAEPADTNALPEVFYEHKLRMAAEAAKADDMTEEQVEAYRAEALEAAKGQLQAHFAQELLTRLADLKESVRTEVTKELTEDPAVAGAKTALESLKTVLRPFVMPEDVNEIVKAKDDEITALKAQLGEANLKAEKLERDLNGALGVAKEVGYKFFIEKTLAGNPNADTIKSLIGDVKGYNSSDEIKAKIEAAEAEFAKRAAEAKAAQDAAEAAKLKAEEEARKVQEAIKAAKSEAEAKLASLAQESEAKIAKLSEALERSVEANKLAVLQLYTEQRLSSHPKASQLRKLIESSAPESQKEIDELIESFRPVERDPDAQDAVRARVRTLTHGGLGRSPLEEETPQPKKTVGNGAVVEDYNGLGIGLSDLKKLAGIPGSNN